MCSCNAPLENLAFCTQCGALNKIDLKSPFQAFDLEELFSIDEHQLHQTYLSLQSKLHPDRFIHCSEQKNLAQDYAAYLNTSYRLLKNSLQRAEFLLKDYPENISQENLMEQMYYRELLETLTTKTSLEQFEKEMLHKKNTLENEMKNFFEIKNLERAKNCLMQLKYLSRLLDEIREKQERL